MLISSRQAWLVRRGGKLRELCQTLRWCGVEGGGGISGVLAYNTTRAEGAEDGER